MLRNGVAGVNPNDQNIFNDRNFIDTKIYELIECANTHDAKKIKCKLKELVPEYTMSDDECVL